jgi:GDSL-like Lipase/Acylhydrolase family
VAAAGRIARSATVVVSAALALVGGELVVRRIDGYALNRAALVRRPQTDRKEHQNAGADLTVPAVAARYVPRIPVPDDVDREWFLAAPTVYPAPPRDSLLDKRYVESPRHMLDRIYEFNELALQEFACKNLYGMNELDTVYAFRSYTGSRFPTFRFPQSKALPSGLKTNRFGWRGPEIPIRRRQDVIRIAFVGASTTIGLHGYDFSYPEFVGRWLNLWAQKRGLAQRFEAINAGHEGTNSEDIAGELVDVVAPVDPDLVVYYEGANQFWPKDFVSGGSFNTGRPSLTFPEPGLVERYSAIAVRLVQIGRKVNGWGGEARKAHVRVQWPKDLDEFNPQVDYAELPTKLPTIVKNLNTMYAAMAHSGGELALSSFVWLAYDGMKLDLPRQEGIWIFLNRTYWPFPYSHIRRIADFQNRVFANVAKHHNAPFLDVASLYPQDPNLFRDAVHMTEAGIRLQAWIAFTQLLPVVDARLKDGRWPRPVDSASTTGEHPAFARPVRLAKMSEFQARCALPSEGK